MLNGIQLSPDTLTYEIYWTGSNDKSFQRQEVPTTEASAETMLGWAILPNADVNKQRKQRHLVSEADLRKMFESYENIPLGVYMNNIVRFLTNFNMLIQVKCICSD